MARLYAEITSDKGGRVVGKGGNNEISVRLYDGNTYRGMVEMYASSDGVTRIWYTDKHHQKSELLKKLTA